MSIKQSVNSTKQNDLENLKWNFKQYIVKNKIINDLPKLVIDQIHTLSHNLSQCSFINNELTSLEGQVNSEEYIKQLVFKNSKIANWETSKENISKDDIKYFKTNFAIDFKDENIFEYSFSRNINSKRDIKSIVIVAFPQYYYVKFQVMSNEIPIPELLDEQELTDVLQVEFN